MATVIYAMIALSDVVVGQMPYQHLAMAIMTKYDK